MDNKKIQMKSVFKKTKKVNYGNVIKGLLVETPADKIVIANYKRAIKNSKKLIAN